MSNSFRGYAEIEIGGSKRPVCVNVNTLALISERHNMPLSVLLSLDSDKMSMSHLRTLVWAALIEGARKSGIPTDFTIEDVGEWITGKMHVVTEILELHKKAAGAGEAEQKDSSAKK